MTRLIVGERHGTVAADDPLGGANAGAIDQDARGPMRGRGFFTAASPLALSATSQAMAMPLMLSATSAARLSLTSMMATFAPAAARARAVAAPSPDAPPVTMAACPLVSISAFLPLR